MSATMRKRLESTALMNIFHVFWSSSSFYTLLLCLENFLLWWPASKMASSDPTCCDSHLCVVPHTQYQGLTCVTNRIGQKWLYITSKTRLWKTVGYLLGSVSLLGNSLWGTQLPCLENTQVLGLSSPNSSPHPWLYLWRPVFKGNAIFCILTCICVWSSIK